MPRRAFRRVLPRAVEVATRSYAPTPVEVWAMDEHRVGLKPILKKCWAKRGKRPVAVIRPRYKWLWVVAFVCPQSGESVWWLVPRLDQRVFADLLRGFAQERGAGASLRILLVLDGAGWHLQPETECPTGVEMVPLPPYSPELQPAEHLWSLADEVLVNRVFDTITALEAVLAAHTIALTERTQQIRSLTFFHWWPTVSIPPPV